VREERKALMQVAVSANRQHFRCSGGTATTGTPISSLRAITERERQLVGVNEVAAFLSVKASTVYSWVSSRRIPHYKLGGKLLRFDLTAIRMCVDQCQVERNPKWDEIDEEIQRGNRKRW